MSKRTRRIILCLFALAALAGVYRVWYTPSFHLAYAPYLEKKGEASGQWLRDRLIACGPRAIDPTIDALAEYSPWVRTAAHLPQVLAAFGEPARQELLRRIDAETDPRRRACLVSSLHDAFGDFSRLHLCLDDAATGKLSGGFLFWIDLDVRRRFPDAPPMKDEEAHWYHDPPIRPAFVDWWNAHPENGARR